MKTVWAVATIALLTASCSSDSTTIGTSGSTTSTEASASTTSIDTTPTTTTPTSTEPTTSVPAPIEFELRGEGIGPFDFGSPADDLINAITMQFGAAISDVASEYPDDDGFGGFQDVVGEISFIAQFERTVCWSNEFCATFGGPDAVSQSLAGWTYSEASGATMASTSGVTIGTRWSDAPTILVYPGGCYTTGYGDIDGIQLTLRSDGVQFTAFDESGNYVESVPPADQVSVAFMVAGDIPIFLYADC